MRISGFHLLLTYQCTYSCDHCFVWGSPRQTGVMTLDTVGHVLREAREVGVDSIYFEGGEPFLYYPTLLAGVRAAAEMGFTVGIVSNAYWATSAADAHAALQPFAGLVADLTVSNDLFHAEVVDSERVRHALGAAARLGIPTGTIRIDGPVDACAGEGAIGQLPAGASGVMYRGRAAVKLAGQAAQHPWESFDACPHEDLRDPGRLHVDPFGNLHLCQGILLGNLLSTPARELIERYDPDLHPIAGPLLAGGPAALARGNGLGATLGSATFADACHLCDSVRRRLRARYPAQLGPDEMYRSE